MFECRKDIVRDDLIAKGMENARESVVDNGEMIETVLEWFDDFRSAIGEIRIADELEGYVKALSTRTRSTDTNFELVLEMVEVLKQQIAELRNN